MKPPQILGLVVSLTGFFGWLFSLTYFVSSGVIWFSPNYRTGLRPWYHYLIWAALYFVIGWLLFRHAERVVRLTYRGKNADVTDA
jgi:hypothetical protein